MHFSDPIREFEKQKRYNTARTTTMSEDNISESHYEMNSHETNGKEEPEVRILKQEEVIEQNRNVIEPIMRQLEDLTQILERVLVTLHPNHYPKLDTGASCTRTHIGRQQ